MSPEARPTAIAAIPDIDPEVMFPASRRIEGDGRKFLSMLGEGQVAAAFFDPQYRGVMDKLAYGNEGARQKGRAALTQMPEETIREFLIGIDRVLRPKGHLFLWIDKFHLCEGMRSWMEGLSLRTVDLITWNKGRMGMGYRTRRQSEYLMVFQKPPLRAKGEWTNHRIPDVWTEKMSRKGRPHQKPIELQTALVQAVCQPGELVIDPAAGSFSVQEAVRRAGGSRQFLGADLVLPDCEDEKVPA